MDRSSFWVLSLLALVTMASAGSGEPTFDPIPTPTTPPDLVGYSDELNIFSIEYPPDWQLILSMMDEGIGVPFVASDANFDHSANIVVSSLPFNVSVEEYYDSAVEIIEEIYPGIETHRVSKVDVGGRQAILTESTFESPAQITGVTGLIAQTNLMFIQGKVAWNVTCEYPVKDDYGERCESIVRTVRILG